MTVTSDGVAAWRGGSDIASSRTLRAPTFECPVRDAGTDRSRAVAKTGVQDRSRILPPALLIGNIMENVYWKPIYNLLDGHVEVLVVNAQHIKQVPGRKTDVTLRHEVA
jgi:hypothetical protein